MKKLILSVTAVSALTLSGFAQGINFADNNPAATAAGGYDTTIAGAPNFTQDLNLELLYGTTAGSITTPIVTLLLSSSASPANGNIGGTYMASGDISALGGAILDNNAQEYNLAAGTYFFQVLAWTGSAASYAAALQTSGQFAGASQVFSTSTAALPAPSADISGVGIIGLVPTAVPEPSTLAMAGVGLASMLIFRRRNK
jgi:hypothetical protein